MPKLTINIECGEKTCAKEPGKFCSYFGSKKMGTIPICTLFPSTDTVYTELEEKEGWTLRCPACLQAEKVPPHEETRDEMTFIPSCLCSMCEAKSASCAYGDLRGSQSCEDTRKRMLGV